MPAPHRSTSRIRRKSIRSPLCLGLHVSIAGRLTEAVNRARSLSCRTMQIFSRSPRSWKAGDLEPSEVERFRTERGEAKISPLAIHASYLINLAATDDLLFERSIQALEQELYRGDQLGADYLVVHVGSNARFGPTFGIARVVEALQHIQKIPTKTRLLLENTAGERGDIGCRIEELSEILTRLGDEAWPGLCIDTCHAFAAGYDISDQSGVKTWVDQLEATVGLDRIKLLHMNDSKKGLGCCVDRHEHIGKGKIGLKGFRAIVRHPGLQRIPMILETPKEREGDDRRNLDALLQLRGKS
jgi:deoxyribonuclease IV